MNHVFVDGENVHKIDPSFLPGKPVSITWLMGAKQTKLDARALEELMGHAATLQLVRLTSTGKNALDLALAYYVGRAVLADPASHIHVVSRDKDYDPLIEHLSERGIKASRHDDFSTLIKSGRAPRPAPAGITLLEGVVAHLRKNPKNRPKTRQALVKRLLNAGLNGSESDFESVIGDLCDDGRLAIGVKNAVTYHSGLADPH
jgi:hypothetical protein